MKEQSEKGIDFKMNLKYVNYFLVDNKRIVKKIYYNSFDKTERFPFWILKKCAKEDTVEFNVIFKDSEIIGIEYIIKYDDIVYLMYFAINKNNRDKGCGTQVLNDLTKKYKNIILSIERDNEEINDNKLKRKRFYLRNGFIGSNKYIIDNEVEYEILTTNKKYNITKETLEKRYAKMTNSKFIKYLIGKMFNVYNIKFIK